MIKLELSETHFNTIVQVLGNAPYTVAAPIIAELARQVNEQRPPVQQPGLPLGDGGIKLNG
jgi:16S rRNA A1518/A1519 N6-dimethyltransferase RsmA/KsgA/DIM1 with predicted DNA glycosylase/AP lyase activity